MSVAKNYMYNVANGVLIAIIPIITVPYIARVLGKEHTGIHSFTFSITQYFILIGLLGTLTYGNRAIAYVRDNIEKRSLVFWQIFYFNLLLVTVVFISYIIAVYSFFDFSLRKYYLLQSVNIAAAAFDISWFFYGMEEFKKTIKRNMIIRIVGAALIFVFVKDASHLWRYITILGSSNLLGNIALWFYIPRTTVKTKVDFQGILSHFIPSFRLFLPRVAVQVYTLFDKILLGILASKALVGVYELTISITKMPLPLITSLGTVIMPRISFLFAYNDHKKINEYLNKTFKLQSYIAFLLTCGIIGVSFEFVPWYFGAGYELSVPLMCILSLTIIAVSWSNVIGVQMMIPMKREKEYTISLFIGAAINIVSNLILIPRYNAIGAAISTTLAEFSVAVCQLVFVKKNLSIAELFKDIWKYLTAGVAMLVVIRIIGQFGNSNIITTALQVFIGTLIYILSLIILKSETSRLLTDFALKKLKRRK
jgi:O-antigen/teichoic acid export membrane protein